MLSYSDRTGIAFFTGLFLIAGGTSLIFSGEHLKENFGFILFGLGGIFWGVMASIKLGADTTKEITQNVIDIMILQGIIPPDSKLRITEELKVVKPVASSFTYKYDIEKLIKKTAI